MGCIETQKSARRSLSSHGLTLTWDVLKRTVETVRKERRLINFNMGCIETCTPTTLQRYTLLRLTLTWDLLKLQNIVAEKMLSID